MYLVGCITTQIKSLLTVCIMQDFVSEFLVRYTPGKKSPQNKQTTSKQYQKPLKLFLAMIFLVYCHYVCIFWNTDYVYILWKSQWVSFCIVENWDLSIKKRSYDSKNLSTYPVYLSSHSKYWCELVMCFKTNIQIPFLSMSTEKA